MQARGDIGGQPDGFFWLGNERVCLVTGVSPDASEYFEFEARTGKLLRSTLGLFFTPAPDRKRIAYLGWMVHFAPPSMHSKTVEVDNRVLYPLPSGMSPPVRKGLDMPPETVHCRSTKAGPKVQLCRDVHDIEPELKWSPDSRHIAFVERTYDLTQEWDQQQAGLKEEFAPKWWVVVVGLDGRFRRIETGETKVDLKWIDAQRLQVQWNGRKRVIVAP